MESSFKTFWVKKQIKNVLLWPSISFWDNTIILGPGAELHKSICILTFRIMVDYVSRLIWFSRHAGLKMTMSLTKCSWHPVISIDEESLFQGEIFWIEWQKFGVDVHIWVQSNACKFVELNWNCLRFQKPFFIIFFEKKKHC